MKFSENWLRTFTNPPLASRALADALLMSGIDVETVEPVAPPFDGVVVAEVVVVATQPSSRVPGRAAIPATSAAETAEMAALAESLCSLSAATAATAAVVGWECSSP